MSVYILSHDIGTSGDKATLFREDGRLVASAFQGYPVHYPKAGWAEQDPADYWRAFCEATQRLIASSGCTPAQIAAVSFSGQMMAALPVDGQGAPLRRSIIWADSRATREATELAQRVSTERMYAIAGHPLSPSYSASKIMWLRRNEPELYRRTAKFLQAKDYLVYQLTGRLCTDFSDASGTNLLDLERLVWSEELVAAAGIDGSLLPDLVASTEVVGAVTPGASTRTGLLAGTPVVLGGGDGACATCGAGVVKKGDSYVCIGTSTWLATASDRPLIDPMRRTVTFAHFRKGLYMPIGVMQTGGGALDWLRQTLAGAESGQSRPHAEFEALNRRAGRVSPGSDGLLFLPYLLGERSPWWNPRARGCFIGLSMVHTQGHLLRAVMEGVALNVRVIRDAFAAQGLEFSAVRAIAGGSRSAVWRQVFADVLDRPVATLNFTDEATSVGAAIAGGVGIGLFPTLEEAARIVKVESTTEPNPDAAALYSRLYPIFIDAYERLVPVFDSLSAGAGAAT